LIGGTFDELFSIANGQMTSMVDFHKHYQGYPTTVVPLSVAVTNGDDCVWLILVTEQGEHSELVKLSPPRSYHNIWNTYGGNFQRVSSSSQFNGPAMILGPLWTYSGISTARIASSPVVDKHGVIYFIQNDVLVRLDQFGSLLGITIIIIIIIVVIIIIIIIIIRYY